LETKEQFSDGVGYGWIPTVAVEISDEQLVQNINFLYKLHQREEYYYRSIFMNIFRVMPQLCALPQEASVACKKLL
jgi:hypothetical protein